MTCSLPKKTINEIADINRFGKRGKKKRKSSLKVVCLIIENDK